MAKSEIATLRERVEIMAKGELEQLESRGAWHEHHERNHKILKQVSSALRAGDTVIRSLTADRNKTKHDLKEARRGQFNADKQQEKAEQELHDTHEDLTICRAIMDADQVKIARKQLAEKRAEAAKRRAEKEAKKAAADLAKEQAS
jgi:hypothetical protein